MKDTILLICHKSGQPKRLRNLLTILTYYNTHLPQLDICVIEQNTKLTPELFYKKENYKYVFIKSDKPFNRSWVFNVGVKQNLQYKNYIFSDNDIVMNVDELKNCISRLNGYSAVNPFSQLFALTEESTVQFSDELKVLPQYNKYPRTGLESASGVIMITRDGIEKIKGWDERFEGWGGEDNVFSLKVHKLLKLYSSSVPAYHLNHEPAVVEKQLYNTNVEILVRYQQNFESEFNQSMSWDEIGKD